jgi:hypothetical protein
MNLKELKARIDANLFGWRRLYQPWIVAYLILSNGRASLEELCRAYPSGLNYWDSDATHLTPEKRISSAVKTLETNEFVAFDEKGHIVLNCALTPTEKLLAIDMCLSRSLEGRTLRDCLTT